MVHQKFSFLELIELEKEQISSRDLRGFLNMNVPTFLYGMDKGESISSEQSSLNKLIQVLKGTLAIEIENTKFILNTGENIVIESHNLHGFYCVESCIYIQLEAPNYNRNEELR